MYIIAFIQRTRQGTAISQKKGLLTVITVSSPFYILFNAKQLFFVNHFYFVDIQTCCPGAINSTAELDHVSAGE